MTLRCVLDGLILDAELRQDYPPLVAYDGDEMFALEALEAVYYELVEASEEELLGLEQARYRLLGKAEDFRTVPA